MRCKPLTADSTRAVVNLHIVAVLEKLLLVALECAQVAELHQWLCGTPSIANVVVRTLLLICRLAGEWDLVPEGLNPCRSIVKYPGRRRQQFSTDREFTLAPERISLVLFHRVISRFFVMVLRNGAQV